MADSADVAVRTLLELLEIPGPPGAEAPVAAYLQNALREMGVDDSRMSVDTANEQSEYGGNTGNLIVRFDGAQGGERILFTTHMDTVPDAVGAKPRVDGDRIVNDTPEKALGGDNRAGCAVLLQLARALCGGLKTQPITMVFFIQEEVGLVGARGMDVGLLGDPKPAMAFNFDGSFPHEYVTQVIGTERFNVDITGVHSHAGAWPERGVSAAVIASHALSELDVDGWQGRIQKGAATGSANVGRMIGGTGTNVVMPVMYILAEARSHSREFRQAIIHRWEEAFAKAARRMMNEAGDRGSVRFSPGPTYEAFALDDEDPVVVRSLIAGRRCGLTPACVMNDGGMDANWIVGHGIPAVTFGMGQRQVHTPDEWIDLEDFETACRLSIELAVG
jgi:tripeptide aminopeptidase